MDQKIAYARRRLEADALSPGELANQLGYEDYSSFHRAFKAKCGLSPTEYRNRHARKDREK